jgi:putative FmdB family regulatory protein
MPIYEYRCSACGHQHEALQKLSDAPLVTCPSCRKDTLTKLVSAAGFQLKGSGWYATDFRNGSKPAAKPDAATTDGKAAETKTDGVKTDEAKTGGAKTDGKAGEGKASDAKSAAAAPPAGSGGH